MMHWHQDYIEFFFDQYQQQQFMFSSTKEIKIKIT